MAGFGVMQRQAMPDTHFSSPGLWCFQPLRTAPVKVLLLLAPMVRGYGENVIVVCPLANIA
jgi:hypothetical protein